MIHIQTKFRKPDFNSSLIFTIKRESKYEFRKVAMFSFYSLQGKYLSKICAFLDDLLPYKTSRSDHYMMLVSLPPQHSYGRHVSAMNIRKLKNQEVEWYLMVRYSFQGS
jgi:hypothetical protein